MAITRRVDINVGYSCNERCKFCYYIQTIHDRTKVKDLSFDECKSHIAYIRRQGIEVLEFTGGEPTIRPDLLELVTFARSLNFSSISMISNGLRLADPGYAKACVDAGVDDFLISVHGPTAQLHDRVTEVVGSFDKAVTCINNLNSLGVKVRANCVISGINYQYAVDTLALYHRLGLQTANFILFNPIVEADWRSSPELNVSYGDAAPYLQDAIDKFRNKIRKITVRYIPLCLMKGYEAYVTNMPQIQYDPDEWDYWLRTTIREGKLVTWAAFLVGALVYPQKLRLWRKGWNVFKHDSLKYFLQRKNKVFGPACHRCAYKGVVCDGVWRKYAQGQGFSDLCSQAGSTIEDPLHFLQHNPHMLSD